MQPRTIKRLLQALSREGMHVTHDDASWTVRLAGRPDLPAAEVLLPAGVRPEAKALKQLADLAGVTHPSGGRVTRACASPDMHPGDGGIAIGSVVETEGQLIPAAIGSDINCGMRLHVVDLPLDRFLAERDRFVALMKGDYFLGTRDLPMSADSMRALFREGLTGWICATEHDPLGALAASDFAQLTDEVDRVHLDGGLSGDARHAPEGLVPDRGVVRGGSLGTIGGGNHFVEIQVVEEVLDRRRARAWGVKQGQLAVMIHSGSRKVGRTIGALWRDRARAAWPKGLPYPDARIFPLSLEHTPELVAAYLEAQATAANYGFLNRALLAESLRLRLRQLFGDVEAPLVTDLPHNIALPVGDAGDRWVTRKGACPAHAEQPVIIPGSMGAASYLMVGRGSERHLCSASHGAGRARSRFAMSRRGADRSEAALGLTGVDCVTLRAERLVEEAPAAYKDIGGVIDCQVDAGIVATVARMRPVLTFKG